MQPEDTVRIRDDASQEANAELGMQRSQVVRKILDQRSQGGFRGREDLQKSND